jgi:hypothetical protein
MTRINESTEDMSREIQLGLGFKSSIKMPEDLRELFEALDFSTIFNNYNIPLQMRGDGVQARHVPFILDFIGRHSHRNHIWAYEEPENSLEMGKAFELASQFAEEFSQDKQIFVTTHSPRVLRLVWRARDQVACPESAPRAEEFPCNNDRDDNGNERAGPRSWGGAAHSQTSAGSI